MNARMVGVLLVAWSSGCAHSEAGKSGLKLGWEKNLRAKAAEVLSCSAESIEINLVEKYDTNVSEYRANGCGRTYESLLFSTARYGSWIEPPTQPRASFDLQCPPEQLTRSWLGQNTLGISGCGRAISYVLTQLGWVANNTVKTAPAAPPSKANTSEL